MAFWSTRKPYNVIIEKIIFYEILIILSNFVSRLVEYYLSTLPNFVFALGKKLCEYKNKIVRVFFSIEIKS